MKKERIGKTDGMDMDVYFRERIKHIGDLVEIKRSTSTSPVGGVAFKHTDDRPSIKQNRTERLTA